LGGAGDIFMVCVTGMPGAGKTTATKALASSGFTVVSMGEVIRREAKRRGLGPDKEGQRRTMLLVREEGGPAAVAKLCIDEIRSRGLRKVVIDGARSLDEINAFKSIGTVKVLGIHASPHRRFELLKARGRKDDPLSESDFEARDQSELDLGLGRVVALSDRIVENESISIASLDERVRRVVSQWLRKA
jgi:dephospho-CoA kinase